MTTDAFVRHYTAVADASPVPVLLYNFTAVTGVNLLPAAVSTLSSHPNIVGVKESSGDIAQMTDLVAGTPDGFNVLAGSATTFYASLCVGATGGILALACVLPDACVRLFELTRDGRHAEARRAAAPARARGEARRQPARRAGAEGGAPARGLRRRPAPFAARPRVRGRAGLAS